MIIMTMIQQSSSRRCTFQHLRDPCAKPSVGLCNIHVFIDFNQQTYVETVRAIATDTSPIPCVVVDGHPITGPHPPLLSYPFVPFLHLHTTDTLCGRRWLPPSPALNPPSPSAVQSAYPHAREYTRARARAHSCTMGPRNC